MKVPYSFLNEYAPRRIWISFLTSKSSDPSFSLTTQRRPHLRATALTTHKQTSDGLHDNLFRASSLFNPVPFAKHDEEEEEEEESKMKNSKSESRDRYLWPSFLFFSFLSLFGSFPSTNISSFLKPFQIGGIRHFFVPLYVCMQNKYWHVFPFRLQNISPASPSFLLIFIINLIMREEWFRFPNPWFGYKICTHHLRVCMTRLWHLLHSSRFGGLEHLFIPDIASSASIRTWLIGLLPSCGSSALHNEHFPILFVSLFSRRSSCNGRKDTHCFPTASIGWI